MLSAATPELLGAATVGGYPVLVVVARVFAVFGTAFAVGATYHVAVSLTPASSTDKRRQLAETPVEPEVQDRPSVNVKQRESWAELRVQYPVSPKRPARLQRPLRARAGSVQRAPRRVKFPVSRNR